MSPKQVSSRLKLKIKTVYNIRSTLTRENRIEEKRKSGRRVVFDNDFELLIADFFKLNNQATINECLEHVRENPEVYGDRVPSKTTVGRILKKKQISIKNLEHIPKARNSLTAIKKRFEYVTSLLDFENDGWKFIYVDEFGCNLHTSRRRGRNSVGKPAIKTITTSRGGNLSTCAAISSEKGVINFRSKFCSYNNSEFVAYLDEMAEKLNREDKIKIVMDNASFHHHQAVQEWFRR